MKKSFAFHHFSLACFVAATSSLALAQPTQFTIDPARSSISLQASVLGNTVSEQATGSLATTYGGQITLLRTGTSIEFPGGSRITAANSGSWDPLPGGATGTASANYGGTAKNFLATATAAARNVEFDVTSAPIALAGGGFNSSGLLFQFLATSGGALDYRVTGFLKKSGALVLSGLATNNVTTQATLTTAGGIDTLTLPINSTFYFELLSPNDTVLTFHGQFVATRTTGGNGGGQNSFANWAANQFGNQTNPSVIGPAADPDGDGLPNFVEFAFGLNALTQNNNFNPLAAVPIPNNGSVVSCSYTRPVGLAGVTYFIEVSPDMQTWTPLAAAPTITNLGNGTESVTVTDPQPFSLPQMARFMRLSVK